MKEESLMGQKDEEMVSETTELVAGLSTPNRGQEAALLTHVNRPIHHGFVKPSKSYLLLRGRS